MLRFWFCVHNKALKGFDWILLICLTQPSEFGEVARLQGTNQRFGIFESFQRGQASIALKHDVASKVILRSHYYWEFGGVDSVENDVLCEGNQFTILMLGQRSKGLSLPHIWLWKTWIFSINQKIGNRDWQNL